ncbi:DDB1- and CUL4-associated factor 13 [Neodiprion pinetum]|uniref:DDB1- and CUL4-associated factor 13 n=1 Tax=Neodiprion lecontei TaxID=441921 RepID=A0A6J0CDU5_NEOLC|nr:DDB1- and CUL4-associated factor 13 [Neodiprion lecontei]XP_046417967.1 DDB1- and CUL4-associated factor 13 [Neodiprion fabricii]XP_046476778.1 DDB1- and CUL4-associated factor 13 [Neodiprion pinetum]
MKVKVLCRNPDEYLRETKRDIHKVPRNYDPSLHPFEAAREYTRALNAVKLERVFAKPFIGSLDGHKDSVSCLSKHPLKLSMLLSGAFDGEIKVWNLSQRVCERSFLAHDGIVRGIAFSSDGESFLSIGDDKTIKTWKAESSITGEQEDPINTIVSKTVLTGLSHHRKDPVFATCGEVCQIWEETRNEPVRTLKWGVDSLHDVKFNPIQTNLLVACASDRSTILYDTRESGPLRKVVMKLRNNKISWNPMEAFVFTCASEDYNLYTFDTRKLKSPVNVHMDHVGAVVDVDYAPTGKEFVSGGYDKSIRIFDVAKGHSRDVYHTKRMQRLTCVGWSLDDKYILCGSDEMNIRIWKSRASEKLGVLKPREKAALNYSAALKDKFASHPQVRKIARKRHVPKHIYNAQAELRTVREKVKRKESNRRAHSKPGAVPFVSERSRHVVREDE